MNYNLIFNRLSALLAFVIPISIAGYNLVLGLLLITWMLEKNWKHKWEMIKAQPLFKIMFLYFIFASISLLWTENLSDGLRYLKQYYIFLFLPIFYTSIDRSKIPQFFSAFLAAMIISEIFSYLIFFDLMPFKLKDSWNAGDPTPFMMHSIYSIFLVFAIFLMLTRLATEERTPKQTFLYSFFILTMTINLFINSGRTGQFSLLLALMVFIYLHFQLHWFKTIVVGMIISSTIFLIAYMVSPNFNKRTLETFNSLQHTVQEKEALNDSTGLRFMMWQVASDIIIKNPLIGVGVGDERDSYHSTLLNELPDLHSHIHGFTDLHNTYLKIFVSTGVIGLSLFLMIFFTLYKELDSSVELHMVGAIMVSLMLQYMFIGNLPASYLTILFIFIMSLALKPMEDNDFSHSSVKLSS